MGILEEIDRDTAALKALDRIATTGKGALTQDEAQRIQRHIKRLGDANEALYQSCSFDDD